jgi:hypothetical protein
MLEIPLGIVFAKRMTYFGEEISYFQLYFSLTEIEAYF